MTLKQQAQEFFNSKKALVLSYFIGLLLLWALFANIFYKNLIGGWGVADATHMSSICLVALLVAVQVTPPYGFLKNGILTFLIFPLGIINLVVAKTLNDEIIFSVVTILSFFAVIIMFVKEFEKYNYGSGIKKIVRFIIFGSLCFGSGIIILINLLS
jgi:uncharacterized membrane protein